MIMSQWLNIWANMDQEKKHFMCCYFLTVFSRLGAGADLNPQPARWEIVCFSNYAIAAGKSLSNWCTGFDEAKQRKVALKIIDALMRTWADIHNTLFSP